MNMTNTPSYIYQALLDRSVPIEIIDEEHSLMRYYHDDKWHYLRNCITENVSSISRYICDTKTLAEKFAVDAGMPVPASCRYENDEQAIEFMKTHGSIVVKPLDAAHGHGISLSVTSETLLSGALKAVRQYSTKPAILQQMVKGDDMRLLIIGGKYVAAVRRVPATVVGDGTHTIAELIERENSLPHRSAGKRGRLAIISVASAKAFLRRRISRVPAVGQKIPVVGVGNTSVGGHAEDATNVIPRSIRTKAEKFATHLQLPVCGVDIMLESDGTYHFIEANAAPGFGPHMHPRVGKPRDVVSQFVDMLLG